MGNAALCQVTAILSVQPNIMVSVVYFVMFKTLKCLEIKKKSEKHFKTDATNFHSNLNLNDMKSAKTVLFTKSVVGF